MSRGLKALRLLAAAGREGIAFGELRRGLEELPAPTLSRLLKALVSSGYAVRTPAGLYASGPELEALGRTLGGGGTLEDCVREALAEFAHRTGESVAFARFYGDRLVLVEKVEVADGYKLASRGMVFHAAEYEGPAVAVASLLTGADFERFATAMGSRVSSMADFRKAAADCRERGWRVEPMPNQPVEGGPKRICCAVPGPDGIPVGELHAVCPGARFAAREAIVVESLVSAAGTLAERLRARADMGKEGVAKT